MARYVVTSDTFNETLQALELHGIFAVDTETTGFYAYRGHRLFSIIVSTYEHDYYFNFNDRPDHRGVEIPAPYVLDRSWIKKLQFIFKEPNNFIFMHNAKFDMHMLGIEGITFRAPIMCTQAQAVLVHNRLPSYKLEALAPMIDHAKDDTVEKYITKHKLYTEVDVGKKEPRRDKHFDLVPFEIISQYGLTDGRVTFDLGMHILRRLEEYNKQQKKLGLPEVLNVHQNELSLTKVLYKMEKRGALIDREYCQKAYEYERECYLEAAEKFYALTDIEFEDSRTVLREAFEKAGLTPGKTPKGNPSFSDENLPDNTLANLIRAYRKHYKRAHTYFKNYLDLADKDDVIHASFRQNVSTGRMSSYDPNMQNVPKRGEDTSTYPVRQCFKPRPGFFYAMFDWDQMEYRMLLDRAGEEEVIANILNGLDVHSATADQMGVNRDAAKTLNFMLLYGGGAAKLAAALDIPIERAKVLKAHYFRSLPNVKKIVRGIQQTAKTRGFIVNWYGRRLQLDLEKPYKMPNHYIQGGCGDVCKAAMVSIDKLLEGHESAIIMQVHDELIIEVKYNEQWLLPKIKDIMEQTYTESVLPLTAGIDYGKDNWYAKTNYTGPIQA